MGRAIFLEENVMGKPDQPRPPFLFLPLVESSSPKNFTNAKRLNRIIRIKQGSLINQKFSK